MPSVLLHARFLPAALVTSAALVALPGCELVVGPLPDPVDEQDGATGAGGGGTANGGTGNGGTGNGGSAAGGVSGCSKPCDCDGDGAQARSCGGKDCDDANPSIRPGEPTYFDTAAKTVGFDYDCSSTLDRDPSQAKSVDCSIFSLAACDTSVQGFLGAIPECGNSASWGTCKRGTLTCDPDPRGNQTMRCK